jgi:hypothetical protein
MKERKKERKYRYEKISKSAKKNLSHLLSLLEENNEDEAAEKQEVQREHALIKEKNKKRKNARGFFLFLLESATWQSWGKKEI